MFQINPETVHGGEYATVALENDNNHLMGSISWQIYYQESNDPVMKKGTNGDQYGRRLNVAFYLPWR